MHDEFSALFRTQYHTFHDLILYGVKLNDSHPAGVQVFLYYWIKLFGIHEIAIKLPFALLGVGSVWLAYRLATRWFNKTTGLLTASFLAVIQYTVFYSQLARPYSAGLFFTLLSVWFWSKIVFEKDQRLTTFLYFVLASAANAYIHAFTLYFLLIQLATGIFFLRKKQLLHYLYACVVIGILYLPHVPIFLAQLSRGGIGDWLHTPSPWFLIHYFFYLFQYSYGFLLLILGITLYLSIKHFNKNRQQNRLRIVAVVWFFVAYLTAYFYSILRTPVIQFSTLYFVSPFAVMVVFSFIKPLHWKVNLTAILMIMVSGVFVLLFGRHYYQEMYKQGFDEIPKEVVADLHALKHQKNAVILQAPDTRMFDYYFKKIKGSPPYFKYNKSVPFKQMNRWLTKQHAENILYGGADYPPLFVIETLKDRFPYLEKQKAWFNAEYFVLSKEKPGKNCSQTRERMKVQSFQSKGKDCFTLSAKRHYTPALEIAMDTLPTTRFDVLNAAATLVDSVPPGDALLVFDWRTADGKSFYWSGKAVKDFFYPNNSNTFTVHIAKRLQSIGKFPKRSILKIYVWKRDSSMLSVQKLRFYITKTKPVEQGLFKRM